MGLSFVFAQFVLAGPGHQPVAMPKDFESLKQLVGTWEGTNKMGDKDQSMTVIYDVTSAGTALTEKLMAGTPHEMISVYHKDGNTLGMTHYCALGNQPHMMLKKADATTFAFEMTKPIGVSSMKEPHMHAVTLTLTDADTLKQEWAHFENGKLKETTTFTFKRKRS